MKKNIFLNYFLLLTYCSFAQTQAEMNEDAAKQFLKTDKKLNEVYNKILTKYKTDTAFTKNLKSAQKIWIQFRDAEMNVKYPDREARYYGSVFPMCWSLYKEQLTNERIKVLQPWLDGTEEGDACNGSVKLKDQ
jgi:uncharacterized protein YecT (DUF1311 family)